MSKYIEIIHAKQNNLKNVSINIKKNEFTVVTGVSGSGKSSLIFDVLYGEGQRKFLEINNSGSAFSNLMTRADVEAIKGLTPVVALEQKKVLNNPRSTVSTMTGLASLVRELFAKAGYVRCPKCQGKIHQIAITKFVSTIIKLPEGYKVELRSPIHKQDGQSYENMIHDLKKKLLNHINVDNKEYSLLDIDDLDLEKLFQQSAEIVLDKFSVNRDMYKQTMKSISVMKEVVHNPLVHVILRNPNNEIDDKIREIYEELGCCEHEYVLFELSSSYFSYNDPKSACPNCLGIGMAYRANPDFMVINPKKGLYQGALHKGIYNMTPESLNGVILYTLSVEYGFDLYQPYEELPDTIKDVLMYGTGDKKIKIINTPDARRKSPYTGVLMPFRGFVYELEREHKQQMLRKANGEDITYLSTIKCMIECECPVCSGLRLRKQFLDIEFYGNRFPDITHLQFRSLIDLLEDIDKNQEVSNEIHILLVEIVRKLKTLSDIGLYYLNLDRRADSISGGEAQRIKLAGQIGSDMTGIVYIMDEPSIGLHSKNTKNLVHMIKKLVGENTVVVVEHNLQVISEADNIIEIGPGAGVSGGEVIAQGTLDEILSNPQSLTKEYLLDSNKIKPCYHPREGNGQYLQIRGASQNNLKNVSVDIPLNKFVCVTGVSGSGKSTLINDVLFKRLQYIKNKAPVVYGKCQSIEGLDFIKNVINIDQKEIGTSSNSSPATYMNIFTKIRDLFAALDECIKKGYSAQNFSLTNQNGLRCPNCDGKGVIVTNLQYMPDIRSVCPVCMGDCYSREGLQFPYKGKNIAEILKMSIDEAAEFFKDNAYLYKKLSIMQELGLGYLKLGQHTSTVSGGEAQRIKLAYELSKNKGKDNNLYIFDEPSTGLHASDIEKLLLSINRLVDAGNSVIVIEHDMDIIKASDYVIDLGPDGGKDGGTIVAQGTPYELSKVKESYTGQFLKEFFE